MKKTMKTLGFKPGDRVAPTRTDAWTRARVTDVGKVLDVSDVLKDDSGASMVRVRFDNGVEFTFCPEELDLIASPEAPEYQVAQTTVKAALIRNGFARVTPHVHIDVQFDLPWTDVALRLRENTFLGAALASQSDLPHWDPAVGATIAAERATKKLIKWLNQRGGA